jgi:hypothetical protein
MTYEKYINMCEQLNKEPEQDEIPPEIDDFPIDVQKAMILFNKLGDRIYPDIGYLGKDYTQLPVYMDVYEVENKKLFLETLIRLDSKIIQKSASALKAERDRLKRTAKK